MPSPNRNQETHNYLLWISPYLVVLLITAHSRVLSSLLYGVEGCKRKVPYWSAHEWNMEEKSISKDVWHSSDTKTDVIGVFYQCMKVFPVPPEALKSLWQLSPLRIHFCALEKSTCGHQVNGLWSRDIFPRLGQGCTPGRNFGTRLALPLLKLTYSPGPLWPKAWKYRMKQKITCCYKLNTTDKSLQIKHLGLLINPQSVTRWSSGDLIRLSDNLWVLLRLMVIHHQVIDSETHLWAIPPITTSYRKMEILRGNGGDTLLRLNISWICRVANLLVCSAKEADHTAKHIPKVT